MALSATNETLVSPVRQAYAKNTAQLADAAIRLTTGKRIVRTGDDSSSISSAATLTSQRAAERGTLANGARATSFLQVAYDGLDRIRSILDTLDSLASAATGTGITTLQYAHYDAIFQSKLSEIDDVVDQTTFNGEVILDGSASEEEALVGAEVGGTITLDIPDVTSESLFASPVNLRSSAAATTASTAVTSAQQAIDEAIAKVEAYQTKLAIAEAVARRDVYSVTQGIDALLATDEDSETQSRDATQLRQDTTAALLAQTKLFNSDLLKLVQF